jgi:hypothetical protein
MSSKKKSSKKATARAKKSPLVRGAKKTAPKAPRGKGGSKISGRRPASAKAKPAQPSAPATPAATAPATSTPDMVLRPQLLSDLAFAHSMVLDMISKTPVEHALTSPGPGHNHLTWQVGHLAETYAYFRALLDGQSITLPETYKTLFGWGSVLNPDSSVYPPFAEVKANFDRAYNTMLDVMKALPASDLALPPTRDTGGMATQRLDVISRVAWHDGWHVGQIAALRRALGLPPGM